MHVYHLEYVKYKLRGYEKLLALKEIEGLFPGKKEVTLNEKSVEILVDNSLDISKLKRLTFFSNIYHQNSESKVEFLTDQTIIEGYKDSSINLFNDIRPKTSKEIRYLTHSLHEYKGRFYPQIVKSLMNYANVQKGDTLLDPFCGSGTALVESFLMGINAVGLDANPIAVLLTKSKVESLFLKHSDFDKLKSTFNNIDNDVNWKNILIDDYKYELDIEYLRKWFPLDNLRQVLYLKQSMNLLDNNTSVLFAKVILSNLLRDYSFQDPSQLRIRRRKDKPPTDLLERFKKILYDQIDNIEKFHLFSDLKYGTKIKCYLGDVRNLKKHTQLEEDSVDLVITSPPYATALPYIDTDRLSLYALGFTQKSNFRILEESLIGNREISKRKRDQLDRVLEDNFRKSILPPEIIAILKKIYLLNKKFKVGFRRKNTAALLYKYFIDMGQGINQISKVLKRNKFAFIIVGNNRTTAGNETIKIPTSDFIGLIAEKNNFKVLDKVELTVQKSYQIHSKNSINSESILIMKKK